MTRDHHQDLLVVRIKLVDLPVPGEGGVAAAELREGVHVAAAVLVDKTVHWELVQSLSGAEIGKDYEKSKYTQRFPSQDLSCD